MRRLVVNSRHCGVISHYLHSQLGTVRPIIQASVEYQRRPLQLPYILSGDFVETCRSRGTAGPGHPRLVERVSDIPSFTNNRLTVVADVYLETNVARWLSTTPTTVQRESGGSKRPGGRATGHGKCVIVYYPETETDLLL